MQEAFRRLDAIVRLSRTLPTIALFDVVWRLTFAWLQSISKKAATYLQQTYFQKTQVTALRKQMHVGDPVGGGSSCWFAGFWIGVTGTYPGSGCGTQPLESFHAYWQSAARSQARAAPTEIFNVIQKIYKEDWSQKFKWGEKRSFLTWPDRPAQDLLNSQTLRTGGRSPAVDFWANRGKKLSGLYNYFKLWRRTDKTSAATQSQDGITTFWVMRARKFDKVMPADAVISQQVAESVGDLISCDGSQLHDALRKCNIVEGACGHETLNVQLLERFLDGHCAVIRGHMADALWPRVRRKLQKAMPSTVCTCLSFMQHADCEHIVYVKAMEGDEDAEDLRAIPVLRPKGRKRKADLQVEKPSAKKLRG